MDINAASLRKIRDSKGMNQKEFAEFLGISTRSLQDYEGGKRIPPAKILLIKEKLDAENADTAEEPKEAYAVEKMRFEDVVAENVVKKILPYIEKFQDLHIRNSKSIDDMEDTLKELAVINAKLRRQVKALEAKVEEIHEFSKETNAVVKGGH